MKKISIIIPMYNVAQYLKKCIDSVYAQGLQDSDFEVVIIDDESLDDSLDKAKKLTLEKKNVIIISQKNKGLGGARNTGIEYATGTYVLFLDSDDFLLPNKLKNIIKVAKENDLDVLEFGAKGIDKNGNIVYSISVCSENMVFNGIEYYRKFRYMDSACNKLYKRDFLNKNNLRFVEKIYVEDYEFNTRVFAIAQKVMAIPTIVSHFLQSTNSITRNNHPEKLKKMKQDIIEVIKQIENQKNNSSIEKHDFYNQRLSFLTATLFYQLFKNKASYNDFVDLKSQLTNDKMLFFNYPIYDKKKNYFRLIILKNFFLIKWITKYY